MMMDNRTAYQTFFNLKSKPCLNRWDACRSIMASVPWWQGRLATVWRKACLDNMEGVPLYYAKLFFTVVIAKSNLLYGANVALSW